MNLVVRCCYKFVAGFFVVAVISAGDLLDEGIAELRSGNGDGWPNEKWG